jgi:hypothetical protein
VVGQTRASPVPGAGAGAAARLRGARGTGFTAGGATSGVTASPVPDSCARLGEDAEDAEDVAEGRPDEDAEDGADDRLGEEPAEWVDGGVGDGVDGETEDGVGDLAGAGGAASGCPAKRRAAAAISSYFSRPARAPST